MADHEVKKGLCITAARLIEEGYIERNGCLSLRKDNIMYITPENTDLNTMTVDDLAEVNITNGLIINGKTAAGDLPRHLVLYRNRDDINAIIHSTSSNILCSSRAGEVVKPLLDDMAQIVGISIRTAPETMETKSLKRLVKAFRGRNTVFLNKEGALCGSASLDDAHAVCQVSEKACKSWIETAFLGGGHKINTLEAALMRFVYLKKYSQLKTDKKK